MTRQIFNTYGLNSNLYVFIDCEFNMNSMISYPYHTEFTLSPEGVPTQFILSSQFIVPFYCGFSAPVCYDEKILMT